MKIHESQIASVAFLCTDHQGDDGPVHPQPRATGFFVSVLEPRDGVLRVGEEVGMGYVATARHNIEEAGADPLYIRVNRSSGDGYEDIPTSREDWYSHDTADVALLAFVRPEVDLRMSFVPTTQFVDAEHRFWGRRSPWEQVLGQLGGAPVEVGHEVAFLGLFAQHAGQARNLPIARFGHISRMPAEPILVRRQGGYTERIGGYLAECRSWGGHSGSPVLWTSPDASTAVEVPNLRKPGETMTIVRPFTVFGFLGLVSAHYDIAKKAAGREDIVTEINAGVAVVTPAEAILELLMREDVVKDRERRPESDKIRM
ncbi:serine protease family protein [Candidatus Solirubrobacter pratensis]|uniref:hypothetical protein n=1 Tax=Candidatus Solirubrobacter pratensis TaxID=1298857 RepID=UPI000481CECD|nr:hypothetical protein [Candidatus Solirubrobacter pratensis]